MLFSTLASGSIPIHKRFSFHKFRFYTSSTDHPKSPTHHQIMKLHSLFTLLLIAFVATASAAGNRGLKDTKAPATKDTKAPSTKDTKAPSTKDTKAPKSTKAPSVKSTKAPNASTKSPKGSTKAPTDTDTEPEPAPVPLEEETSGGAASSMFAATAVVAFAWFGL